MKQSRPLQASSVAFVAAIAFGLDLGILAACSDSSALPAEPDAEPAEEEASRSDAGNDAPLADARIPYDPAAEPVVCDASPCAVRVVAGRTHYCALLTDRTVRCWGEPSLLGAEVDAGADGGTGARAVPGVVGAVDIAATATRTCAVLADGGVDCWGNGAPARVADVPPAKRVFLGEAMACVIALDGEVVCWGASPSLGSGRRSIDLGGRGAASMAIGSRVAFVLDVDGELRSWGTVSLSPLGRETSVDPDLTARPVSILPKVRDVVSSPKDFEAHACAVTADGRLFCWGAGRDGRLGLGYIRNEDLPVEVDFPDLVWPHQVSASETHSCVRMTNGTVRCWGGQNLSGELGVAGRGTVYIPVAVEGLPDWIVSVAAGSSSTCALTKAGVVSCWGANGSGQLGRGTRDTDRHPKPAPVVFP